MTSSPLKPTFHPSRRQRGPEEQEAYEALAVLSRGERLVALRDVPLPRSTKLSDASRIALGARQLGLLGEVLAAIRSYWR